MPDDFFEQKWLQSANGKICYFHHRQSEDNPTAVFLHGLSANHTTWNNTARALSQLGLNCLMPDQRGHGYSDKTRKRRLYEISVFTQDLQEIIAKENLSKIVLVGYSFGGFIALDYIIKNPAKIASLILISANHVNPLNYKRINFLSWPAYFFVSFLAWLLSWQKRKHYYYFNQDKDLGYWRSTLKGFITMPLSVNLWMLSYVAKINFSREIDKITCPTLLLRSQTDTLVSLAETEDMARKIKTAKIVTIEESSHFLASRYQEKTLEAIIKFLTEEKII